MLMEQVRSSNLHGDVKPYVGGGLFVHLFMNSCITLHVPWTIGGILDVQLQQCRELLDGLGFLQIVMECSLGDTVGSLVYLRWNRHVVVLG